MRKLAFIPLLLRQAIKQCMFILSSLKSEEGIGRNSQAVKPVVEIIANW